MIPPKYRFQDIGVYSGIFMHTIEYSDGSWRLKETTWAESIDTHIDKLKSRGVFEHIIQEALSKYEMERIRYDQRPMFG